MAEEKYAKAKCFILSPEGYQEISYLELCRRRDMEPDYQNRKFIPLHGMLMEVTPEQYAEFYRIQNRQRYMDRRSADNGDISVDMLTTDEFNGADILVDPGESIDELVIRKMQTDKLIDCLSLLEQAEQLLIRDLFYNGLTERDAAQKKDLTLGTKHLTVSDLSDADLVPPMLFRTICNAMAIRRFGLAAIKEICHD